jgi:hypothetical protein
MMMKERQKTRTGIVISLIVLFTCACFCLPSIPFLAAENSPTLTPTPTRTEIVPTTPFVEVTDIPVEEGTFIYGSIKIIGDPRFIRQTIRALVLLQVRAPNAYRKVVTYVGVIEHFEKSVIWTWEDPPRMTASDDTAYYSVPWYAAAMAHESLHSELYNRYQEKYGGDVPDDIYSGVEAEKTCIAYQLDVITKIGGAAGDIEYLAGLDGTHCDVDKDGDCDNDDYELQDW